jgi:hypothetical protein
MIVKKGLIVVCLLLFSSQAFAVCDPMLPEADLENFKVASDLFAHCMMIQGAIMIKRGETGRDNILSQSLSRCKAEVGNCADVLVNAGCSKTDALQTLALIYRQSLDIFYSNAQRRFQQTNEFRGGMKRWVLED